MRLLVKALALTALAAAPVLAQGNPQTRQGFTISFGLGAGTAGATCEGCGSDREWAPSAYLRLGGTVKPNLILAGEVNGWTKSETDADTDIEATITISTVNFVAQWYPDPMQGFFVSGGVGLGTVAAEATIPGFGKVSDNTSAFGYQVGTGYDFRVGKNFSLSPFATYFATVGGKTDASGEKIDGNVFHFGLGFTWH